MSQDDLDDVTPPAVRFKQESILFGTDPETQRNNLVLDIWRDCKAALPPIVTGPQDTDDNPLGRLYNILFVRTPTIVVGLVYLNNVLSGHALIVDLGMGPLEVSPLIVATILFMILRIPKKEKGI